MSIEATGLNRIRLFFMKNILLLLIVTVVFQLGCSSQGNGKVKWLSFEEAIAANKENPKKIFIDIYTDWCSWCKKMDRDVFSDSTVAAYMNDHFYCVKLNAETKDTIYYRDVKFQYYSDYKCHSLAVSLLDGKMSYPSYVILTGNEQRLKIIQGYQDKETFLQNLKILANWSEK